MSDDFVTVHVPREVRVPTDLVERIAAALMRQHSATFSGQLDRPDNAHARRVAETAGAAAVEWCYEEDDDA